MSNDTLGDLSPGDFLSARCPSCDRSEALDIPALVARLGPDFEVTDLRDRLRCSQCGRRAMFTRGFDPLWRMHQGGS